MSYLQELHFSFCQYVNLKSTDKWAMSLISSGNVFLCKFWWIQFDWSRLVQKSFSFPNARVRQEWLLSWRERILRYAGNLSRIDLSFWSGQIPSTDGTTRKMHVPIPNSQHYPYNSVPVCKISASRWLNLNLGNEYCLQP